MTASFTKAAVLEILRTPAASDTFPDMIRRVEALEGCGASLEDAYALGFEASGEGWNGEYPTADFRDDPVWQSYRDKNLAALEPVAQPETPIPGQFETMCLAIEDVITGRGFDVDPWQPIETAPENEGVAHIRGVWVHNATTKKPMYFDVCPGYLEDGGFIAIDGEDHGWRPDDYSHWMPLPQPPGETTSAIPEVVKWKTQPRCFIGRPAVRWKTGGRGVNWGCPSHTDPRQDSV